METIRALLTRLRAMARSRKLDAELDEELRSHLEEMVDEYMERGMTEDEAKRKARLAFGGVAQTREAYREQRGFACVQRFAQDTRYALRQFHRAPGYAVFTTLVLALGIAVVTAMFTVAYAVLLKPLPFKADRHLFQLAVKTAEGEDTPGLSYDEIKGWRQATTGSADIAFIGGGLNIADGPGGAELINEVETSENLFSLLGAQPMMGRTFLREEQETHDPNVVVLSNALWRHSFSGDPHVVGKTLRLGGILHTVVGVMPPEFLYPLYEDRAEAWVPLERKELTAGTRDTYLYYQSVIRVHLKVPLQAVAQQLAEVHKQFDKTAQGEMRLRSLHDLLVADVRPALLALEIAVALVWLIACANVAGLMLARVAARRTEIAVRAALGAGRGRIVAQFLAESFALSCAGALGGLALAAVLLRTFRQMLVTKLPLASTIQMNWAVWLALLALTLMTTLAFGAFPAWVAARVDADAQLKHGGRTQAGDRGQRRARSALLVAEVALSITLLTGAGLMMRTMYALRHVPLGFRTDHLILTGLTLPNDLYKDRNASSAVWLPLLSDIREMPGVSEAGMSTVLPIRHPVELETSVFRADRIDDDDGAMVRAASPELMHVLGIRMRRGRFFTDADTASSLPVAVVNQTFVNRFLKGGDAIGQTFQFGHVPRTVTIVGVIEDIHQDGVAEASRPEFYLCMSQLPADHPVYRALPGRFMEVAIRTEAAPDVMIPALRRRIQQTNPHLAIGETTSMEEAVEDSIGAQKLAARVIGVFGGLVLLNTVLGLYGLLNYLVTQRTQEIGIRMALGANRGRVVGMVLRQTLVLLGAGTVIGVGLAFAGHRLIERFLFGVSALDPWAMALAPLALVTFGVMAALLPARRAAGINPVEALRAE